MFSITLAILFSASMLQHSAQSDQDRVIESEELLTEQTSGLSEKKGENERRQFLAVEFFGGLGTGEFHGATSGLHSNPRGVWGAGVSANPLRWFSVYAGYSEVNFGCSLGFCRGADVIFSGKGVEFGLKLRGKGVWAGAGLLNHSLDVSWNEEAGSQRSAVNNWGYDLRGGIYIPFGRSFNLKIGGRYSSYDVAFPGEDVRNEVNYLSGEVRLQVYLF